MTKELTTREKIELFILIVVLSYLVLSGKVEDKFFQQDEMEINDDE